MSGINDTRRALHLLERTLGDINAIGRGRILQRLYNRLMGRGLSRITSRIWR